MIFQRYICYVKKIIIDQNVFITGLCHLGLKHWAFPNSLYDLFLTDLGKTNSTGSAWKISVDTDAMPDLLLIIEQKLCIVQYWYGSLSQALSFVHRMKQN